MAKFIVTVFHINASAKLKIEAEHAMEASCKTTHILNNGQVAFGMHPSPFHIEVIGPIIDVEIEGGV